MAKSAAKRKRAHQLRNTGKDVTNLRNDVDFSTHVRLTKTKKEKLQQLHNKHKKHFQQGLYTDGNAFYVCYIDFNNSVVYLSPFMNIVLNILERLLVMLYRWKQQQKRS